MILIFLYNIYTDLWIIEGKIKMDDLLKGHLKSRSFKYKKSGIRKQILFCYFLEKISKLSDNISHGSSIF